MDKNRFTLEHPESLRRRLSSLSGTATGRLWPDSDSATQSSQMRALGRQKSLTPAAVLVPLVERDGQLWTVLTKRTSHLRTHSGQISFPGGRRDPTDIDLMATALRESSEEIGLSPSDVHVFGPLTTLPTITGYHISAFVGEFVYPYQLRANPDEVDALIEVPLKHFCRADTHAVEMREFHGRYYPIHFYDFEGHIIWGATAALLDVLMDVLRSK